MSVRYFRAEEAIYEQVRATLDSAWGHPTEDGLTQTCIAPAAIAPRGNADGLVYLAVYDSFCDYAEVASMLPGLLASGAVEEIDEATYLAATAMPDPPMPTAPASSPTLSPAVAPSGGGTLAPGVAPSLGGAIVQ